MLISNGAKLDIKDRGGWTPLHYAAINENFSIVKLLLDGGKWREKVGGLWERSRRLSYYISVFHALIVGLKARMGIIHTINSLATHSSVLLN